MQSCCTPRNSGLPVGAQDWLFQNASLSDIEPWIHASGHCKRAQQYNESVVLAQEYAGQGNVLSIAPDDTCGVDTLSKKACSKSLNTLNVLEFFRLVLTLLLDIHKVCLHRTAFLGRKNSSTFSVLWDLKQVLRKH